MAIVLEVPSASTVASSSEVSWHSLSLKDIVRIKRTRGTMVAFSWPLF